MELNDHCLDLNYSVVELDCMNCEVTFKFVESKDSSYLPEYCPECSNYKS